MRIGINGSRIIDFTATNAFRESHGHGFLGEIDSEGPFAELNRFLSVSSTVRGLFEILKFEDIFVDLMAEDLFLSLLVNEFTVRFSCAKVVPQVLSVVPHSRLNRTVPHLCSSCPPPLP